MACRNLVWLAALAVCALAASGCKSKGSSPTADLDKRCVQIAKSCGDKDKHIEKITTDCQAAAKKQVETAGCAAKVTALYDCYEKELCSSGDRVWALDDLRVLADRHKKCVSEREAAKDCSGK
jgi:hypothetical protein